MMKVEIVQAIRTKESKNGVKAIHKYIETEIKPSVGDYITNDSFWSDPYEYEVKHVELDLTDNSVRVVLDDLLVGRQEDIDQLVKTAVEYHEWEKGGFLFG